MAASHTVPQVSEHCNFIPIEPRHGVITLYGYGIDVRVDRGHLIIHDGIGSRRTTARFARIGHGIRRIVVIGSDGSVSLSALRWLADQDASFVMLDRDGSVLLTTGPVRPSDARLRRAQSLAHQSGIALQLTKDLLDKKLIAQEQLVREKLQNSVCGDRIAETRRGLAICQSVDALRALEALGAKSYWSAWRNVPINFPKKDMHRIPSHWQRFGFRVSPLTGSPRLAVNPPNAMLNYLYAILESESRLAAAALGLDPGLGFLHFDSRTRDSLASDLMEPIRPKVDSYVFDWITREPLRREWFFENRDGNCRLIAKFAQQLSETASMWAHSVAPLAEWLCHSLWKPKQRPEIVATHLTQTHRREARGGRSSLRHELALPRVPSVCKNCGVLIDPRSTYCTSCARPISRNALVEAAKLGRIATHSPESEALRAATHRRHQAALREWNPSDLPSWLTEKVYREQIETKLASFTVPAIASVIGVSHPYATDIREGKRIPHPRHWQKLAGLVGLSDRTVRTVKPNG